MKVYKEWKTTIDRFDDLLLVNQCPFKDLCSCIGSTIACPRFLLCLVELPKSHTLQSVGSRVSVASLDFFHAFRIFENNLLETFREVFSLRYSIPTFYFERSLRTAQARCARWPLSWGAKALQVAYLKLQMVGLCHGLCGLCVSNRSIAFDCCWLIEVVLGSFLLVAGTCCYLNPDCDKKATLYPGFQIRNQDLP